MNMSGRGGAIRQKHHTAILASRYKGEQGGGGGGTDHCLTIINSY